MALPGPRMTIRERQKMQTREHLLEVAIYVVGHQGFASASIDDIVKAAGASRATFYAHFDGKDAILKEIVARMWRDTEEQYAAFAKLPDWSRPSIEGWLTEFANAHRRDVRRNTAAVEAWTLDLVHDNHVQHGRLVSLLLENRALWQVDDAAADARASMIISLLQGEFARYFFQHVDDVDEAELAMFVGHLADGVRDLLGAA